MLSAHADMDEEGPKSAEVTSEKLFEGEEEAGPSDDEEDECLSDLEENCSDEDEDELGGTRVNVDITRALRTLREGTFEGVGNDYTSDDAAGSIKWRACAQEPDAGRPSCPHVEAAHSSCPQPGDERGNEKTTGLTEAAEASAASTPDTEGQEGAFVGSKSKNDESPVGPVHVQGAVVLSRAPSSSADKPRYQYSLSPRPLTDARIIAEAHAPTYAPLTFSRSSSNASGDEYGFYAQGEVQRITADDGFDLEEALLLQEGGLFTDRQRRWMKIPDGDPGPCSPSNRPASALPSKQQRKGKKTKWRSPFWVPFSVIVAALPACDSPQVPMARAQQDDVKRKHMEAKVADCERAAAKALAQGRFMDAIEAVETNIRHRARGGLESPSQLLCMLQATAFLCGAYAVECIHRKLFEEGERLLEHAEGLTRKGVLKKCRETDLVRCGLRAATFNVNALLHRQMGEHAKSFRMLQRALKIARQKQGLEVLEAATLVNMGSVLMSQGQLPDAITIVGASLSLLSKHELEAAMAWQSEASLHQHISAGDVPSTEAGGRAGRSARINAIWAMVAMAHHNRGAMQEAARRNDTARHYYERALEIAHTYLGPSSRTATVISAALSAQQSASPGVKGAGGKLQPSAEKKKDASSGGWPRVSVSADGEAARRGSRKRPDPVQVDSLVVRSPDSMHRMLVESCGYVHWGHAPTGLRHKTEKEERLKKKAGPDANSAILPTLLYFDDSPCIDGLGLPAPLLNKGAGSGGGSQKKPSSAAGGGGEQCHLKGGKEANGEDACIANAGVGKHAPMGQEVVVRGDTADVTGRAGLRKHRGCASVALLRSLSCPVSDSPPKAMGSGIEKCVIQARDAEKKVGSLEHRNGAMQLPQVKKTLLPSTENGAPSALNREKTPLHTAPAGPPSAAPDTQGPPIQRSLSVNYVDSTVIHSKPAVGERAGDGVWGTGSHVGREVGHAMQRALEKRPAMLAGNGALFNALSFPTTGRAGGAAARAGLDRAKEGALEHAKKSQLSCVWAGSSAGGRAVREGGETQNNEGDHGKPAKAAVRLSGKGKVSERATDDGVDQTISFLLGRGSCGALRISTATSIASVAQATPLSRQSDAPQQRTNGWAAASGALSEAQAQQVAQSAGSDTSRPETSYVSLVHQEGDQMKTLEREADERVRRLLGEASAEPDLEGRTYFHAVQGGADGSGLSCDRLGAGQLTLGPLDNVSSDMASTEAGSNASHSHQSQAQPHPRLNRRAQRAQHPHPHHQAPGSSHWCGRGNGPNQMVPRPPASASGGKDEKRRNGVETVQLLLNRINKSRGNAGTGGGALLPMQCDSTKASPEDVDSLRIGAGAAADAREATVRASWHAGLGMQREGDMQAAVRAAEEKGDSARRGAHLQKKVGSQMGSALCVLPDVSGASACPPSDAQYPSFARNTGGGSREGLASVRASLPR